LSECGDTDGSKYSEVIMKILLFGATGLVGDGVLRRLIAG